MEIAARNAYPPDVHRPARDRQSLEDTHEQRIRGTGFGGKAGAVFGIGGLVGDRLEEIARQGA